MSKFFIIACIYDNKKLVGYRILSDDLKCVDSTYESVIKSLKENKVAIENAKFENGKVIGTNGSLSKLAQVDFKTKKLIGKINNAPYIIIGVTNNTKYTIVNYCGKYENVGRTKLVEIHDTYGVANCKIIRRGDKIVISSISGGLNNTNVSANKGTKRMMELTPENEFIRNGLVFFNVQDESAFKIVETNKSTVPMEILKKYCIGPIYINKKGSTIRVGSITNKGYGENYYGANLSSMYTIPANILKSVKLEIKEGLFEVKIVRSIIGNNCKCIDICDTIVINKEFEIVQAHTSQNQYTLKTTGNISESKISEVLYKKVARALGISEYTNAEEFLKIKKRFKNVSNEVWVLNADWSLTLDNMGETVGFSINSEKEYCYIVDNIETVEEMDSTYVMIAERPNSKFSTESISRKFTVKLLELTESNDEKSALIKFSTANDIIIDTFIKVNILNEIALKMGVKNI